MRRIPATLLAILTGIFILAAAGTAYLYSLSEDPLFLIEIVLIFLLYLMACRFSSYNLEWSEIISARKFAYWLIMSVFFIAIAVCIGVLMAVAPAGIMLIICIEIFFILAALRIFFLRVGMILLSK